MISEGEGEGGVRVCFIRPSRVIISSNNTSYDLNRKEFNVLLAVAILACTHPG